MLYQSELGGVDARAVLAECTPSEWLGVELDEGGWREGAIDLDELAESLAYARALVGGTLDRRDEIDGLIAAQAENWRLERMPAVDRNILRLAVFELLDESDVPKIVVLDEAIELAKKYGSEQSGAFVNGLLDGLLKAHAFPGRMT